MGCIFSTDAVDDGGSLEAALSQPGEIHLWIPGFREPQPLDLAELLKGVVSAGLAAKLNTLRAQIVSACVSSRPGNVVKVLRPRRKSSDSAAAGEPDLENALIEYLPVLVGLVTGGEKFSSAVAFPWTNVIDETKESVLASGYYELLSVLHLLGLLAIQEANMCLTPRPTMEYGSNNLNKGSEGMCFALHPVFAFGRYISASLSWNSVSDENKRDAIEILLKAASYFECAIKGVLPNTPAEIKAKLPADVTEAMLRSLELQALGQAVELQLGFAVDNVKASLAVKRRLACEQIEVWDEAVQKLASVPLAEGLREKQMLFVKWKNSEAKAAAYYFHGLVLDEGYEDNSHAEALSCLKAAHACLKESQRARNEFSNTEPLTKVPPLWGPMKYLAQRIPRETVSKGRIFRENYTRETMPATTPKLPEFPIALEADPFDLPPSDVAWKKERGYEAKPSMTADIPSFLARKNSAQTRQPVSDLRRATPMAPPRVLSDMVQAR